MASILPFDELNSFRTQIEGRFGTGNIAETASKEEEEDIIDEMLDLFLLAYAQGNNVTNETLSFNWTPNVDEVMETVNAEVADKTWKERVEEYFSNGGTGGDLIRIAETETHRIANTAALGTAKKAGAKTKTWRTMLDDRVREQHDFLEGVTVGIDDDFITSDGDQAPAPGLFSLPENNINCRCELSFS